MLYKFFLSLGILFLIIGILIKYNIPIFKLPGDIIIKKGNITFYFPIITGIILSILLTIIFNLFFKR